MAWCFLLESVASFILSDVHISTTSSRRLRELQRRILCQKSLSKWDDLDGDDDSHDNFRVALPGPKDMRYLPQTILKQNSNFVAIREAGGASMTADIYARNPDTDVFWFAGKLAHISDVSVDLAVARQWPLIEEHACRLRPIELFPKRGILEIWTAPGDSEMEVAYNRPNIMFHKMKRTAEVPGAMNIRAVEVGFQGEIYDQGEDGFRTLRTEDGAPKENEIQPPEKGPKVAPTDKDMEKIQELLKGKDLNEFFDK